MTVILDMRKLNDRETAHDYLREMLHFPSYYGKNLDALNDCLGELTHVDIRILHTGDASDYGKRILRVFEDNARENGWIRMDL